ncbi:MAG: dihydrolipoyl dehydrogenase [Prevotellaceae bacterium]|jgi:dihydrolipoamide dehydrogenase|nr:dihydrolipoyl dehydrogenase [Prevotellaceae bacterium]
MKKKKLKQPLPGETEKESGNPYVFSNIKNLMSKIRKPPPPGAKTVDVLIIGCGPGGYAAAVRASQLGLTTAVVEFDAVGGMCLNWGCIPTKSLLKSAQVLHYARQAADYGVQIKGRVKPDVPAMVTRSRNVVDDMKKGIEHVLTKNNIELIKGMARVNADRSVSVFNLPDSRQQIFSDHIIIATGASPRPLPFAPFDHNRIISSQLAIAPARVPKLLTIVGSGAIGCEMAWFFNTLGTKVTLIESREAIAPAEDADVSAHLARAFRKAGISVFTSAQVVSIETKKIGCKVALQTKRGEATHWASSVLVAVGTDANVIPLALDKAGVVMEQGRIKVDKYYRTSAEGVYAIGDVIATPALAHVASAEAVVCVEHLAGLPVQPIDYSNIPMCIYTVPETASVGFTEQAAREKGYRLRIGKAYYMASGKAAATGEKDGFVKLIFNAADDTLLGAHLVGANVTELIAGLVTARQKGATASDIMRSVYPHPTMSEAIIEAASSITE